MIRMARSGSPLTLAPPFQGRPRSFSRLGAVTGLGHNPPLASDEGPPPRPKLFVPPASRSWGAGGAHVS
jgi:hypothetical protein